MKRIFKEETCTGVSISYLTIYFQFTVHSNGANAMYLPIKISSNTGKQIETVKALLDSRASRKFIDQDYAWNIHAERKNLERPIQVYNMDGTPNKKGTITQYVELEFEIHKWKRKHRLLVTGLGNQ